MKRLYNWCKSKVQKVGQSKYKHVAGFLAFVMIIGLFGGFNGMTRGIQSSSSSMNYAGGSSLDYADAMVSVKGDSYSGGFMDSISNAVAGLGGGSKSESAMDYDYYAPEAPMESPIVSEDEYLTTDNTAYENKTEKLVYSASLGIETKDMDVALEHIYSKINEYNGIIQDERQNNMGHVTYEDYYRYSGNASAYIFVRIPQEHYNTFINSLEDENGDIVVSSISKNVQNMTQVYYDTESRLRSLRVQEERLFEFMESAGDVSDMLSVEDRLTDVQYEIDSATNSLLVIDNDVKYSKVTLNIEEVVKYSSTPENPKNFIERVWMYITDSAENFAETLEYWLECAIYFVPYFVLLVIVYIVFIKIKRKIQKKRKVKKELENQEKEE